jgi:hypothetical protein
MKKLLLLSLLIPSIAFSQGWQIGNPVGTPRALPTPGTTMGRANVDIYGNQQVVAVGGGSSGLSQSVFPLSNASTFAGPPVGNFGWVQGGFDSAETGTTTTVINATAHTAEVGDLIYFTSGSNTNASSPVLSITANTITVTNAFPVASVNGNAFLILRPVPWTFGVGANSTNPIPFVNLDLDNQNSIQKGILKDEDRAALSGDAGVGVFAKLQSAITNDATADDYSWFKADTGGRVISTLAPAGETFQNCSASNTGTSDIAIKAAVASNRIYVTSISCFNTAAVASSIVFKDGSTQIYVGGVSSSTLAGVSVYTATLPTPLRGTANTALNFAMGTTATATTCCAAGYISTI